MRIHYVRQVWTWFLNLIVTLLALLLKRLKKKGTRVSIKTHIVKGVSETTIPETAKALKSDLIVMGTVGRSGPIDLLIGNTAESVLMQINCPVLTLKPAGFEWPLHFD